MDDLSRIDLIAQNGNEGEHYLVEEIAQLIYSDYHTNPRYGWEDFLPLAMSIIEKVRRES